MSKKIFLAFFILVFTISCNAIKPKKVDTRKTPISGAERARQNVDSGGGVSLKGILKGGRGTNFEFSTSNPLWRASLEVLDFMPLSTVDYSGGMIVSDWYSENNQNESIKITIRFLSNEVRSENLKVIVHKKVCSTIENCRISLLENNAIRDELLTSIIRKAAALEIDDKNKKKKK